MSCEELITEISGTSSYSLHTHTQFCDGRAPMHEFAQRAVDERFGILGFTPHSPVPIDSPCNMKMHDVNAYFNEIERLRKIHNGQLKILAGMEIDFLSEEWGAHNKYFASLPLDYSISSIHFITSQDGIPVDIDGSFESFRRKMTDCFHNDIRFVVESFVAQTHKMLDLGGFQILGHFDKIAMNGDMYRPGLVNEQWYDKLMKEVIDHIAAKNYIVEINTKAYGRTGKFFPSSAYWPLLKSKGVRIIVNSDAHYPELLNAFRPEALELLAAAN